MFVPPAAIPKAPTHLPETSLHKRGFALVVRRNNVGWNSAAIAPLLARQGGGVPLRRGVCPQPVKAYKFIVVRQG